MGKEPWDSSSEKAKELKISDFGTPEEVRQMAKMPLIANSFAEAREVLEGIVDKLFTSKSGLSATISKSSIDEILSGEASKCKPRMKRANGSELSDPRARNKMIQVFGMRSTPKRCFSRNN